MLGIPLIQTLYIRVIMAEYIKQEMSDLNEHHFMRIADYMELTGLRRAAATMELRQLREDPANGITTEGKRNGIIDVKWM